MRRLWLLVPVFVGVVMLVAGASVTGLGSVRVDVAGSERPKVSITTFSSLVSVPLAIAAGPDGALWLTNWGNSTIGRITTSGTTRIFKDPNIHNPQAITAGPDGALWFTNLNFAAIGRITTRQTVRSGSPPTSPLGGINNRGQIIGWSTTGNSQQHAVLWMRKQG